MMSKDDIKECFAADGYLFMSEKPKGCFVFEDIKGDQIEFWYECQKLDRVIDFLCKKAYSRGYIHGQRVLVQTIIDVAKVK